MARDLSAPEGEAAASAPASGRDLEPPPGTQPLMPTVERKPSVPISESRARGSFQGLTGGYGDELSAGLAALLPFLDKEAATGASFKERYQHARDFYRGLNKKAHDDNPGNYTGSEILAGVATAPFLPGGAASLPAALATGTGFGALTALGSSNADLTRGQYAEAGKDTSIGALMGLGGGALGYGVSRGLQALPQLQSFANRKALNALGAMKPQLNQLGSEEAQRLGRAALEEGVVSPLASKATMAARAQAGKAAAGQDIGSALATLDAGAPNGAVNSLDAAAKLDELSQALSRKPALKTIAQKFANEAENIRQAPEAGPMSLQRFEEEVARPYKQVTNWNTDLALPRETLKQLPRALEAEVERRAQEIAQRTGSDAFGAYQSAKGRYGNMAELADIAEEGLKQQASNHTFGLKEVLGALGGATAGAHHGTLGSLGYGLVGLGGGKLFNRFGDQLAATGANQAAAFGRWLAQHPQTISKLGAELPALERGSLGDFAWGAR